MTDTLEIPDTFRPPDRELYILAGGFFGQQSMLCAEWVNWAIDYTNSDLRRCSRSEYYGLVSYYNYCKVLQQACINYLEGTI